MPGDPEKNAANRARQAPRLIGPPVYLPEKPSLAPPPVYRLSGPSPPILPKRVAPGSPPPVPRLQLPRPLAPPNPALSHKSAFAAAPGVVQRVVRIGEGPKNRFVKKRAILSALVKWKASNRGALRGTVGEILIKGGVQKPQAELQADSLTSDQNIGELLNSIADVLSLDNVEAEYPTWDAAIDDCLPMILPIATARAGLNDALGQLKANQAGLAGKTSDAYRFAEARLSQARQQAHSRDLRLTFNAWADALSWAQVANVEATRLRDEPKEQKADKKKSDEWATVSSRRDTRHEVHESFSIAALAQSIERDGGAPVAIAETFNQFINALDAQNIVRSRTIVSSYTTQDDRRKSGFSVEVALPLLQNWTLHVHCKGTDGSTAAGENPIHYKRKNDQFSKGQSIRLTGRQETMLIPPSAERLQFHAS